MLRQGEETLFQDGVGEVTGVEVRIGNGETGRGGGDGEKGGDEEEGGKEAHVSTVDGGEEERCGCEVRKPKVRWECREGRGGGRNGESTSENPRC